MNSSSTNKITSLIIVLFLFSINLNAQDKTILDKVIFLPKFKSTRAAFLDIIYKKNIPILINFKFDKKKLIKQQVSLEGGNKLLDQQLDEILKETTLFYRIENNKTLFIDSEWSWLKQLKPIHKTYRLGNFYRMKEELVIFLKNYLKFYQHYGSLYEIKKSTNDQIIVTGNIHIQQSVELLLKRLMYSVKDYSRESLNLSFTSEDYFHKRKLELTPMKINGIEFLSLISKIYHLKIIINSPEIIKTLNDSKVIIRNKKVVVNKCFKQIKKQTKIEMFCQKNKGIFIQENRFQKRASLFNLEVKCYLLEPFLNSVGEKYIKKRIMDSINPLSWDKVENQIYFNNSLKILIVRTQNDNFTAIDKFFYDLGKKYIKRKKK
ncbi:MAG: hypothetical protein COA79_00745 [Planctomycetota bacterium]|nr:MAG: hypothetical protein COA79_00745 [Planctomycetota bacterium]